MTSAPVEATLSDAAATNHGSPTNLAGVHNNGAKHENSVKEKPRGVLTFASLGRRVEPTKESDTGRNPPSPVQFYNSFVPPVRRNSLPEDVQDPEFFEKDYVQTVRESPYHSAAWRWLAKGALIFGILAVSLGPILLIGACIVGAILGFLTGLIADLVKLRKKHTEIGSQKNRIRHLMRWSDYHFASSEEQLQLIFKVILEYQAMAELGKCSQTARRELRLLYKFLSRKDVQHVLSSYLDYFFVSWRQMGLPEICMCSTVFEVCIQCCVHLNKAMPAVIQRMDGLLKGNPAVQRLFAQAERLQRKQKARAVKDRNWVLYADADAVTAHELFVRELLMNPVTGEERLSTTDKGHRSLALLAEAQPVSGAVQTRLPKPKFGADWRTLSTERKSFEQVSVAADAATTAALSERQRQEMIAWGAITEAPAPGLATRPGPARMTTRKSTMVPTNISFTDGGNIDKSRRSSEGAVPAKEVPQLSIEIDGESDESESGSDEDEVEAPFRDISSMGEKCELATARTSLKSLVQIPMGPLQSLTPHPMHISIAPKFEEPLSGVSVVSAAGGTSPDAFATTGAPSTITQPVRQRRSLPRGESFQKKLLWHSGSQSAEPAGEFVQKHRRQVAPPAPIVESPTDEESPEAAAPKLEKALGPGPASVASAPPLPGGPKARRLFRSLSDLVAFDEDLKHQTPIGSYEFDFLRQLEVHESSLKGWECAVNRPTCQVYKLKSESPVVLIKAYATLEGFSVDVVSFCIRHIPTRMKWDKTFEDYRLIERNVEGCEVIYCLMKAPWPIANRDFLQWRRTEIAADTGNVFMIMRSASHPNYPERASYVRAETIVSGYIIRRLDGDPNSAKLFILAQTDVRGLIPKFAVNQVAQKAPIQWTDSLRKACQQFVKKHGVVVPSYDSTVAAI